MIKSDAMPMKRANKPIPKLTKKIRNTSPAAVEGVKSVPNLLWVSGVVLMYV